MAIISTIVCDSCGERKSVTHSASDYPSVCGDCRRKEKDAAKAKHLTHLAGLTVEERLARIEENLYDEAMRPEPSRWDGRIG